MCILYFSLFWRKWSFLQLYNDQFNKELQFFDKIRSFTKFKRGQQEVFQRKKINTTWVWILSIFFQKKIKGISQKWLTTKVLRHK